MRALQQYASEHGARLHIRVRPGAQVYPGSVLASCERVAQPDAAAVRDAFIVGAARTYEQDPRFGLIVLSEVAQRALSPAVNDPGTAIAVLNTLTRVLIDARPNSNGGKKHGGDDDDEPLDFDRLTMPNLDESDFITQSFDAIARDGAAIFEVQVRMQKVLAAIGASGSVTLAPAARQQAGRALERADKMLMLEHEKTTLRQLFESLHRTPEMPQVL